MTCNGDEVARLQSESEKPDIAPRCTPRPGRREPRTRSPARTFEHFEADLRFCLERLTRRGASSRWRWSTCPARRIRWRWSGWWFPAWRASPRPRRTCPARAPPPSPRGGAIVDSGGAPASSSFWDPACRSPTPGPCCRRRPTAGPARLGDVYRACQRRPAALLIIDGLFDQQLAVWHKEILWALAQGVRVYGAASMGALRAAELAAFGMVGVGAIFQAFSQGDPGRRRRSGRRPRERERRLSPPGGGHGEHPRHAAAGRAQGLIGAATRERLIRAGKAMFYPQRSLPAILAADPEPDAETGRLSRWLEESPRRARRSETPGHRGGPAAAGGGRAGLRRPPVATSLPVRIHGGLARVPPAGGRG